MQKNEVRTIRIEKLAGEMGLAHVDGMAVFVKNALPGETVEARIEKVQKNCAFLKTVRILEASSDRAEPPCPIYWQCGGCQTQHMRYALSLEMKREEVKNVQERIGGVHLPVPPVMGMEDPWHYRNKI
ncbi:MAG: class I SAM-dependent RNA methyltransferase, partial [Clostridia bacterium]|nr:class I SAM-dependent RNA methyltransferase [Clostridia bacterium]